MASQAISSDVHQGVHLHKDQLHECPLTFKQSCSYRLFWYLHYSFSYCYFSVVHHHHPVTTFKLSDILTNIINNIFNFISEINIFNKLLLFRCITFPSSAPAWRHTSNSVTRNYCCGAREVTLSFMDTLIALTYLVNCTLRSLSMTFNNVPELTLGTLLNKCDLSVCSLDLCACDALKLWL